MADDIKSLPDKKQAVQDSFNNSMLLPKLKKLFSDDSADATKEALNRRKTAMKVDYYGE